MKPARAWALSFWGVGLLATAASRGQPSAARSSMPLHKANSTSLASAHRWGACVLSVVGFWVGIACVDAEAVHEASGVLVDVRSEDIVRAESITLRGDDGTERLFRVAPEVVTDPKHPSTGSHLRLHMLNAEHVTVRYRETADGLLALQVRDEGS